MSWATALPLSERVSDFLTRERPEGVLLSAEQVIGQALAAVNQRLHGLLYLGGIQMDRIATIPVPPQLLAPR